MMTAGEFSNDYKGKELNHYEGGGYSNDYKGRLL